MLTPLNVVTPIQLGLNGVVFTNAITVVSNVVNVNGWTTFNVVFALQPSGASPVGQRFQTIATFDTVGALMPGGAGINVMLCNVGDLNTFANLHTFDGYTGGGNFSVFWSRQGGSNVAVYGGAENAIREQSAHAIQLVFRGTDPDPLAANLLTCALLGA